MAVIARTIGSVVMPVVSRVLPPVLVPVRVTVPRPAGKRDRIAIITVGERSARIGIGKARKTANNHAHKATAQKLVNSAHATLLVRGMK